MSRRALASVIDALVGLAVAEPICHLRARRGAGALGADLKWLSQHVTGSEVIWRAGMIPIRNLRTPGQRVAGIRRVDAATGGPLSVRRAIVAQLVDAGVKRAMNQAWTPLRRRRDAGRAARPPDASPPRSDCLTIAAIALASASVQPLTARLSEERRTLADRLAGTAYVTTRG